jgi:malate dehydrogenase (oxaloacetate-decarboxylating)
MQSYRIKKDAQGQPYVECPFRGEALLSHSMYNKGTAFTKEEREQFGLKGLLPTFQGSLEEQVFRAYRRLSRKTDPLEMYIGLAALQDRNETLFFQLMLEHLEEFAPIVYTPTVGQACQMFSTIFRRGRGLWITPDDQGNIYEVLGNSRYSDIRLIVVTDNERILGLGDQGAGGIGIPIGKLVLYCVAAGIHPSQVLPISLDVGTDNKELLEDPMYIGWPQHRIRGERYHTIVEEFVDAVKKRFPRALLQWEDFKKQSAFDHLDKYREKILSFNDDIQGTASVALAGAMAASRITKVPFREQRIVILGAGAAGIGIARQLRDAFSRVGLQGEELIRAIAVLDSRGLLLEGRPIDEASKQEFVWSSAIGQHYGIESGKNDDFLSVVRAVKPHVLIGTSGEPGSFTKEIVEAMAAGVERPVIFPFSNPTSLAEGVPDDIIRWTKGKALVATGSPFNPVEYQGKKTRVGQGNNVFIFPGIGLGALVAEAKSVTDSMFTVAAETLAEQVTNEDLEEGALFPSLKRLRAITKHLAAIVAVEAGKAGVAAPLTLEQAQQKVAETMWDPAYIKTVPV